MLPGLTLGGGVAGWGDNWGGEWLAVSAETGSGRSSIPTWRARPRFSRSFPCHAGKPSPQGHTQVPRRARTALPHDQDVATLILNGQEDLGDHDEDPALGGW